MANSFSFERQRIVSRGMDGVKAVKIREGERSASDSILFLWHTCGWHKEQTFVNRLTRLKKKKKKGEKIEKSKKNFQKDGIHPWNVRVELDRPLARVFDRPPRILWDRWTKD